jgi:hypothetical protein
MFYITSHDVGEYQKANLLGGVVVSVLTTGPKGRRFEPGQGYGFLRAIKIHITRTFRWEVKPEVPCHKILQHVNLLEVARGRTD